MKKLFKFFIVMLPLCPVVWLSISCGPPLYEDGSAKKYRITHGSGPDAKVYIVNHDKFSYGIGWVSIRGHDDNVGWDDTAFYGNIKVEPIKEQETKP